MTDKDETIETIKNNKTLVFNFQGEVINSVDQKATFSYNNTYWGMCGRYLTIYRTDPDLALDIKELRIKHILGVNMFDD